MRVIRQTLLVSSQCSATTRLVSLSCSVSTITLSFSKCRWTLVPLVLRSKDNLCWCLFTSDLLLVKRIPGWGLVLVVLSSIELNVCVLLLVHLFTHSMPKTVGQRSDVVEMNHGQRHRWSGRRLHCAAIRAESSLTFAFVS